MNRLRSWRQDQILRRVLRNSSYLFASYALGAVLTLVTANLLGAASFGVLGVVTVFSSTINRLFSFRMGEMVVKYMGEALAKNDRQRAAAAVKVAMLVEALTSLLAFAALALLAPVGAVYFAKDASTTSLFLIYGISIIANLIYESSIGVLQVTNHYRSQALINFVQTALVALLLGLAAVYHAGLTQVLWIYLIGKIIIGVGPALVAFYWLPRALGARWWRAPLSVLPAWRELLRFSINTNFHGTVTLLARDNEIPIISFFFGPEATGYYKIALALVNLIITPINPFISTTYPEITRSFAHCDWRRLRLLLQRVTMIAAGWTGLVTLGLIIGHPLLFERWTIFGRTFALLSGYAPAYPVLLVLLIGYGAANIFFWNRPLLLAQGETSYPLRVSFWAMLVKVLLTVLIFWLLPRLGIQLPSTAYLIEALLLSGYFLVTVAMITWRGLRGLQHAQAAGLQGEPA